MQPASTYTCLSASSADMCRSFPRHCSPRLSWLIYLPLELASGRLPWVLFPGNSRALSVICGVNGMTASGRGTSIPHHDGEVHGNRMVFYPWPAWQTHGRRRTLASKSGLKSQFKVDLLALCSEVPTHPPKSGPWHAFQKTDDHSRI